MPTAPACAPPRARAALCGCQFISSATWRMRARVASLTPGRPLSAKETALGDTPTSRAMSAIVSRALLTPLLASVIEYSRGCSALVGSAVRVEENDVHPVQVGRIDQAF